jgi:hypothetical protein
VLQSASQHKKSCSKLSLFGLTSLAIGLRSK